MRNFREEAYFEEKNLNINNELQYKKGMESFKQETLDNINHYLMLQKEKGLYIKVLLQKRNKKMKGEATRQNIQKQV